MVSRLILLALPPLHLFFSLFLSLDLFLLFVKAACIALRHGLLFANLRARWTLSTLESHAFTSTISKAGV